MSGSEKTKKKKKMENGEEKKTDIENSVNTFLELKFLELVKMTVDQAVKVLFVSPEFKKGLGEAMATFQKQQKEAFDIELDKMKTKIDKLEKMVREQAEVVKQLGLDLKTGKVGDSEDVAEKKERLRSVVMLNVPELNSHFELEKNKCDLISVNLIIQYLNIGVQPMAVYRLGRQRQDGRPRLLKVVMPNSMSQRELLNRAPKLKTFNTNGHPPVYVRKSMSREELVEFRAMRAQQKPNGIMVNTRGSNSTDMQVDDDNSNINVTQKN
ncbi:hypothetical protein B9Z55_021629 [Caenorhabditis nigoni]|uniref:Uncharacterized protein n=1 Tax=Caenorhabditis nigoni TaxID=1611254 RepID=A0A2G5TSZ3_9PELO|nr:hypothetical protein B9Z55_021629 [Caenorhabditis nigoni]